MGGGEPVGWFLRRRHQVGPRRMNDRSTSRGRLKAISYQHQQYLSYLAQLAHRHTPGLFVDADGQSSRTTMIATTSSRSIRVKQEAVRLSAHSFPRSMTGLVIRSSSGSQVRFG